MIVELHDINIDTEEGRLLCRAIGLLMVKVYNDKTPEEILEIIKKLGPDK